MAHVSGEEVQKLAELSRMQLEEQEISGAAANLSAVLEHFENITAINTDDVPPADDVTGLENVSRDDIAEDGILAQPSDLLANAKTMNGYVVVSGVFADNGVS